METSQQFELVLWATDVFALAGFLERVADGETLERHPGFAEIAFGEFTLAIHSDEGYRGHPWYDALTKEGVARGIGTELRFGVLDVSASFDRARRLGAQVIAAPYEMDGRFECTVMGPDGYLVSLFQDL